MTMADFELDPVRTPHPKPEEPADRTGGGSGFDFSGILINKSADGSGSDSSPEAHPVPGEVSSLRSPAPSEETSNTEESTDFDLGEYRRYFDSEDPGTPEPSEPSYRMPPEEAAPEEEAAPSEARTPEPSKSGKKKNGLFGFLKKRSADGEARSAPAGDMPDAYDRLAGRQSISDPADYGFDASPPVPDSSSLSDAYAPEELSEAPGAYDDAVGLQDDVPASAEGEDLHDGAAVSADGDDRQEDSFFSPDDDFYAFLNDPDLFGEQPESAPVREESPGFETEPSSVPDGPDPRADASAQPDLSDYLSYEDYDNVEENPPEPVQRRRDPVRSGGSGGLFGFLKKRPPRDAAEREEVRGAHLSRPEPSDPEESEPSAAAESESASLYAFHDGARGRAEREAREMIASMQAESGAVDRRERLNPDDFQFDLDDLLSMSGDDDLALAIDSGAFSQDAVRMDPDAAEEDDVRTYPAGGSYTPDAAEPEIDPRFNLGGQDSRKTISYADNDVDLSADEDYSPSQQAGYSPSQWTPDYDDPLAERQDDEAPARKKHRFLFSRKAAQTDTADEGTQEAAEEEEETPEAPRAPEIRTLNPEYRDSPDETPTEPDDEDFDDYDDESTDESSRAYRESEFYAPPTFKEYLLSILASVWLKLRGTVRGRTAETMVDYEEDLGEEVTPAAASKYYGSFLRSYRYRLRISAAVLAMMLYISLEMPVPGMMKSLPVDAMFCFGLQGLILLLSLDVAANALSNAVRLRFGADSLVLVSCLFTGLDALIVALSPSAAQHMPLCAISSMAVVGLLLSSYLSARGLRKATRVPAIGKTFFAVTGENTLEADQITLLKSRRSVNGFVRRTEEAGPDEVLYQKLSPALFCLALLLTLIVTVAKKSYPEFIYILSAQLVLTVPFGALLSFALPFFIGSSRIFKFGAAIAGWSGLCDIGTSKNIIVTDRDLFPESAVTIENVRIFADEDAQKVISYAGSMIGTAGCCSAGCFAELMRETGAPARKIDGFEVLPGGGMKGIIDGQVVLCGSTDLMRLMNVRIPFRLTDKTTVLLAINGILYGIFSLKYEGLPQVRRALSNLVRTAHPPVFAVRDFNINPEMLHETFDLATDGYDFPSYVERFRLSEPTDDRRDERITAVLCNEGLAPLTSVAAIGRSMYVATNINLVISAVSSILGVLLVFLRFLTVGSNSVATLFLYMAVWIIPVLIASFSTGIRR